MTTTETMRKSGFLITPRQYAMLVCVRDKGDPGHIYKVSEGSKWERTWRTLQDRGFVHDRRTIAEDGETIVIPKGGPWGVTVEGIRAIEEHERLTVPQSGTGTEE